MQEYAECRHEAADNAPGDLQCVVPHGNKLAEGHERIDERREYENVGYLQQLHGVEVATQQGDLDQHEDNVHDKGPRADGEGREIRKRGREA